MSKKEESAKSANVRKPSNLDLARIAKKCAASTYCGIVKSLYAYAETEEGKDLNLLLPKDKKAMLNRGAEVCAFGGVGTTKVTKTCSYVIKISADIVLRFLNNEQKQKNEDAKAKKTAQKSGTQDRTKANKGEKLQKNDTLDLSK